MNQQTALWGMVNRYEGMFSIAYYFSLMFVSSFVSKKYKKVIVGFILASGVIQCIYALCQIYDVEGVEKLINYTGDILYIIFNGGPAKEIWATGFITNPNFFGTFMLLCASYSIGLYIDGNKIALRILYLILFSLFIAGIMISNTVSCVVGILAVALYLIIYCIKNKYIKKLIIVFAVGILVVFLMSKTGKTKLVQDVTVVGQTTTQIARGNVEEKNGTYRIFIWRETWNIVPKYLLHGVGVENFSYAFDGKALVSPNGRYYYDKAHNEYLHTLVTQGIFCTITYIVMYAIIVVKGTAYSYRRKQIFIILPVIGYMVQAFFNISVIEVAPLFFITLGLCMENGKLILSKDKSIENESK